MGAISRLASLLSLCALPLSGWAQAEGYAAQYPRECAEALHFFRESDFRIRVADAALESPEFLFAVVAPEMTQYSHLRDRLEQAALFALYASGGSQYGNFSIGIFQMKPSFVEALEQQVRASQELSACFGDCLIDASTPRQERVERLKRLTDSDRQVRYLVLFSRVMAMRYPLASTGARDERLKLYATAYNSGFDKEFERLGELARQARFPHFSSTKYNYAELSAWFYEQIAAH